MKRMLPIAAMIALILASCQSTPSGSMGTCPCCDKAMAVGHYCKKCNAVASDGTMVPHSKTGKLVKAGIYCAECNCFIFPKAKYNCEDCKETVTRGTYCTKDKRYRGCCGVKYDETKKKPVAAGKKRGGVCGCCHKG